MIPKEKNYAFIDAQNLNLGIQNLGWKLDYARFRRYLREKYSIEIAYLFIGYILENQDMYDSLQKAGYVLKFKPVLPDKDGKHKGNVDADLVLQAVIDCYENHFEKALIVSSDGDFYSLVRFLYKQNRLSYVMSPYIRTCSTLLKKTAKEKIVFMDNLREKLEYKKKSTA
ncbi:MAG: NYN domain-containing protein [bacterium]|nr:NYN domain-containing protein [bacterium]